MRYVTVPMLFLAAIVVCGLSLTGCAAMPDQLEPEVYHESHVLQHFGDDKENFGRNVAALSLNYERGPIELRLEDGYSFHGNDGCGGCKKEVFRATLGYKIPLKRKP